MRAATIAGIRKQSFALAYGGGSIWCEHLDGMGSCEQEVLSKLSRDAAVFSRPSSPAFMIINVDETEVTESITDCLRAVFDASGRRFIKVAVVGARWSARGRLRAALSGTGAAISFPVDYEKAKEWMF